MVVVRTTRSPAQTSPPGKRGYSARNSRFRRRRRAPRYDLIILDVCAPNHRWHATTGRRLESCGDLPVLLVTGMSPPRHELPQTAPVPGKPIGPSPARVAACAPLHPDSVGRRSGRRTTIHSTCRRLARAGAVDTAAPGLEGRAAPPDAILYADMPSMGNSPSAARYATATLAMILADRRRQMSQCTGARTDLKRRSGSALARRRNPAAPARHPAAPVPARWQ